MGVGVGGTGVGVAVGGTGVDVALGGIGVGVGVGGTGAVCGPPQATENNARPIISESVYLIVLLLSWAFASA